MTAVLVGPKGLVTSFGIRENKSEEELRVNDEELIVLIGQGKWKRNDGSKKVTRAIG